MESHAELRDWRQGVTPDEMRQVDRLAEEAFGLAPATLMESAGLAAARVARSILGATVPGKVIRILTGPGNNGGDGLVAARRLAGWGADVTVLTSYRLADARGLSAGLIPPVTGAGVAVEEWRGQTLQADLVVDALLGFGAAGDPRGAIAAMIESCGSIPPARLLAIDIPSGLDAATGLPSSPCVRAGTTVTLALPKVGLLQAEARPYVGRILVADIGIPESLLRQLGIDSRGLFAGGDMVTMDQTLPGIPS